MAATSASDLQDSRLLEAAKARLERLHYPVLRAGDLSPAYDEALHGSIELLPERGQHDEYARQLRCGEPIKVQAILDAHVKVYRHSPQVDHYSLIKHRDEAGAKLRCPYCERNTLEDQGWNDGLRTGFALDGTMFKVLYSIFSCTNAKCPGNPGVSSLDQGFMDANFPSAVAYAYPYAFPEGPGQVYSHAMVDSVSYLFPSGMSLSVLSKHFKALQVSGFQRMEIAWLQSMTLMRGGQAGHSAPPVPPGSGPEDRFAVNATAGTATSSTPTSSAQQDVHDEWTALVAEGPGPKLELLKSMYMRHGKQRWQTQDALVASISSKIISLDHVAYPAKFVVMNGTRPFKQLLVVCNELGEIMGYYGTETDGLREVKHLLKALHVRHERLGSSGPVLCYVDNPRATKKILKEVFPSLGTGLGGSDDGMRDDVYHVLQRVAKCMKHTNPLYEHACEELSASLFDWDDGDRKAALPKLSRLPKFRGMNEEQILAVKASSVWSPFKCRKSYKGPEAMVAAMNDWYAKYSKAQDIASGLLFTDAMSRTWKNQLENARCGRLTDPIGVPMYHTVTLPNGKEQHLSLRNSSKNETANKELVRLFTGSGGMRADLASGRVSDIVFRYNKVKGIKARGHPADYAWDPTKTMQIKELRGELGLHDVYHMHQRPRDGSLQEAFGFGSLPAESKPTSVPPATDGPTEEDAADNATTVDAANTKADSSLLPAGQGNGKEPRANTCGPCSFSHGRPVPLKGHSCLYCKKCWGKGINRTQGGVVKPRSQCNDPTHVDQRKR